MVVAQHIPGLEYFGSLEGNVNIVMRELWSAAVPLFLAISGFFIARKPITDVNEYLIFIKKQIPRVYIPCLIWSLPILSIWIFKGDDVAKSVAKIMACMAHGPYYFIALIIQLYLLHPIFMYADKHRMGGGIILIVNLLSVILLDYLIIGHEMPFVILVGPFVYWMMFYYLGVKYSTRQPKYNMKLLLPITLIAFGVQFIEAYNIGPGIKATTWIWSYLLILILFSEEARNMYSKYQVYLQPLVFIGRYSFGIYLAHVYSLVIIGKFATDAPWSIRWLLVIALTTICVWMADKILPQKIVKYLGLK